MAIQYFTRQHRDRLRLLLAGEFVGEVRYKVRFNERRVWENEYSDYKEAVVMLLGAPERGAHRYYGNPTYDKAYDILVKWKEELLASLPFGDFAICVTWRPLEALKVFSTKQILDMITEYNANNEQKIIVIGGLVGRQRRCSRTFAFRATHINALRVKKISSNSGFACSVSLNLENGMNIRDAIIHDSVIAEYTIDIPLDSI